MDNRDARHAVNILMESPLYLTLSLKERQRLIRDFLARYFLVSDNGPGREPTEESDANAE